MIRKKRLLFVGEGSFLGTGFSTYWAEVIKRLHQMGTFEIAELGSYAHADDPRCKTVPWKFYPVVPSQRDVTGQEKFKKELPLSQFGSSAFDDVCLDFKPDIVLTIRDEWMDNFIHYSPYRKNFKWYWMLTIDGIPQRSIWLDSYKRCDGCLTYSNWAMDVMKKDGLEGTNMIAVASPGSDIDMFCPPENKDEHKKKMGIDPNCLIVGMVSRNQKRKLFYDLIEAFSQWVYKAKTKGHLDLVNRSFLYLHTSYPDVGYDIGRAITEFKVGNKVLLTYMCDNCGVVYPSFFTGELSPCRRCKKKRAHPPNANTPVPRDVLANIMKTFDLGVQYTICEGWSMTITEENSCGVPVLATDYSAIKDHMNNPGNTPINVGRFFYEAIFETEQKRALPDNNDFVNKLDKFLRLNKEQREKISQDVRNYIIEPVSVYGQDEKLPRYSWERTAAIWKNVIDKCEIHDPEMTWFSKESRHIDIQNLEMPQDLDNVEFVNFVLKEVYKRPELQNTYFALEWAKWLNIGSMFVGQQRIPVDRKYVINHFLNLVGRHNIADKKRLGVLQKVENPNSVQMGIF